MRSLDLLQIFGAGQLRKARLRLSLYYKDKKPEETAEKNQYALATLTIDFINIAKL
jgi:hypothetical protein